MKKVIYILTGIILAFIMLLSTSTAMATSEIILSSDYEYVSNENGYRVFGETNDDKSNDKITVKMYLGETYIDTVITETIKKDGKMTFETPVIPIDASKPTGIINFKVYSAHAGNVVTLNKGEIYYGVADLFAVLTSVKNAIDTDDYQAFKTVVKANKEKLGVEGDLLDTFKDSVATMVKTKALDINLNLPSNISTPQNSSLVLLEVLKFRNEFLNLTLHGEFASTKTASGFVAWYNKYKDIILLETYNENFYNTYFKTKYTSEGFYSILKAESMVISDIDKIKERLLEVGALTHIKTGNANSVQKVFTDFKDKIPTTKKAYNVYSVYKKLATNTFPSFIKLASKYDELAVSENAEQSSGGGGGGGGGGVSTNQSVLYEIPGTVTGVLFKDISGVTWAHNAINELSKRGIISGKSNDVFAPNDMVTRAEFVKMLVVACNATLDSTEQIFPDVSSDKWFYSYVNTAYKLNIVNGSATGYFEPDANITRQDMAVMIYRIVGNNETGGNLNVFNDAMQISDYAKNAISYLNYVGAINGLGDGTFAPGNNATRAQAAQMIYNVLNFIK